jgi:hypothetical protein
MPRDGYVLRSRLWLCLVLLVVVPRPAGAYVDPGTGSMVLQLTLAGLAAGLAALRLFWRRIVRAWGALRPGKRERDGAA